MLIHDIATGYEHIDVEAATDYGICVSCAGDYAAEEVSDHVRALILACARKIVRIDRAVREGKWTQASREQLMKMRPLMFRLKGQTLGIIGLGRIGRLIIPKAFGFGVRVITFDPYLSSKICSELGVESLTLDDLLHQSDFVSFNTPLTKETNSLFY